MTESQASHHPMRRTDRELSREDALRVVRASSYAILSFINPDTGAPQGVPVSATLAENGLIYWHSNNESSLTADGLRKCSAACLTFVAYAEDRPDLYSVDYASAVVAGCVRLVTDEAERKAALFAVCDRHVGQEHRAATEEYFAHGAGKANVWCLEPEHVTGKSRAWAEKVSNILAERGF